MQSDEMLRCALTFDDVLLVPSAQRCAAARRRLEDASHRTPSRFNMPLISSANGHRHAGGDGESAWRARRNRIFAQEHERSRSRRSR